MIDMPLAHPLVRAIAPGTRLILVGDVDQLPPVGPGYPLRDIIDSGVVPVARLTRIFRQAQQSLIVSNAHRILQGGELALNRSDGDFFLIEKEDPEEVAETVRELAVRRVPGFIKRSEERREEQAGRAQWSSEQQKAKSIREPSAHVDS